MPPKKNKDEEEDFLSTLLALKQSSAWKWYEFQINQFAEQVMGEWADSKGSDDGRLKGEYKAYKRSLNVVNKKIQDLTQAPPSSPNLDAYSNSHSVS